MNKPNLLKAFFNDEHTREQFKAFQLQLLEEMAVDAVFTGKTTTGFPDAHRLINHSFDKLEELYGKVEVSEPQSSR